MRQTALLCLGLLLAACGAKSPATPPVSSAALEIAELQPGAGSAIVSGQTAVVNYTGWLYEATAPETKGKQFDSSLTGGAPFRFTLGRGQVIQGWDQGVLGMKVGGFAITLVECALTCADTPKIEAHGRHRACLECACERGNDLVFHGSAE